MIEYLKEDKNAVKRYFFLVTAVLTIGLSLVAIVIAPRIATEAIEVLQKTQEGPYVTKFLFIDFKFFIAQDELVRSLYMSNILNILISLLVIGLAMRRHILRHKIELVLLTVMMVFGGRMILLVAWSAYIYWLLLTYVLAILNALVCLLLRRTSKEDYPIKAHKIRPLKEIKYTAKDRVKAVVSILVYLVLYFYSYPIIKCIFPQISSGTLNVVNKICDWSVLPIVVFLFKDEIKRGLKALKANWTGYCRFIIKLLIAQAIVGLLESQIIHMFNTDFIPANQKSIEQASLVSYALSAIIFAPIVEELLFRGALRRFINNKVVFIIVSALLFGFAHARLEGGLKTFLFSMTLYSTSGAFLAYAYAKTNNICTGIICHCIGNAYAVIS